MPSVRPLGDSAAIVKWSGEDTSVSQSVWRMSAVLHQIAARSFPDRLTSIVPAFHSITVHYCPNRTSFEDAVRIIEEAIGISEGHPSVTSSRMTIPVCFDTSFAPDLAEVADKHGVSPEEVIHRFCRATYWVRMIGFSPGFPYLSGLPPELTTPRRNSPRLKVPQGSVAIGGRQAGIYSQETPGGWNIIGRTPVRLFRAERLQPCLLTAGDQIQFLPISADQFRNWQDES